MEQDAAVKQNRGGNEPGVGRWALIFGVWTLAGLVSASQVVVRSRGQTTWVEAVAYQLPTWWIWALLTPLCLGLARRFPVRRVTWSRALPLHVGAGVAVVLTYLALQMPFALMREGRTITWAAYSSGVVGGFAFQFVTYALIYAGLVAIGQAIASQNDLAERERHAARLESELATARLHSLRAQLQPHFLFNTLHTVGGLVRGGEKDGALRMLSGLSGLLRHTLDHIDAPEIALHRELEATERYLEIEEVRFRDRLEVERHIDPDAADAIVPALIFQPLLENAMRHGIQADQASAVVLMGARRVGDRLELIVEDDGAGLPAGFDLELQQGVGLRLTRSRLDRLYGADHTFAIEGVAPRGTRVRIEIPFRTGP